MCVGVISCRLACNPLNVQEVLSPLSRALTTYFSGDSWPLRAVATLSEGPEPKLPSQQLMWVRESADVPLVED